MTESVQLAESDTFEAASSLMPYFDGDSSAQRKGTYLTYRFTGFSVREATELAGIHQATVMRWRDPKNSLHDSTFVALEKQCTGDSRAKFRTEVLSMLHSRNMHLFLRRDEEAIRRVLELARDKNNILIKATKEDHEWATKVRGYYTAQQLQFIENLTNPDGPKDGNINIIDVIMARRHTVTEEVVLASTNGSSPSS